MEYIPYLRLFSKRTIYSSLLLFCLSFFALPVSSQTLYNTAGEQIWIGSEAVVTIQGDVVNRGVLHNNGKIYVSGHWRNQGSYAEAPGKVIFNGVHEQRIRHNGQQISRLELRGGGSKRLTAGLQVTDSLILRQGTLLTSADELLLLEAGAHVAGGNATSFVEGPMVYAGTGYRFFPVGRNGLFTPAVLLDVQGVNPVLRLELLEPAGEVKISEQLEGVSQQRLWEIQVLAGLYEGAQVRLAVGGDEGFDLPAGIVVAGAAQAAGPYQNFGQSDFAGDLDNGMVTSQQLLALPYLMLGLTREFSRANQVLVPSAFAPDAGDPENSLLKIYAKNLQAGDFIFRIFNRWGILVYETASLEQALNQGWNGTVSKTQEPAQYGVYTYYLSARFDNNLPVSQTGTITLFR